MCFTIRTLKMIHVPLIDFEKCFNLRQLNVQYCFNGQRRVHCRLRFFVSLVFFSCLFAVCRFYLLTKDKFMFGLD